MKRIAWLACVLAFLFMIGCNLQPQREAPPSAESPPVAPPVTVDVPSEVPPAATEASCLASGDQRDINDRLNGPGSIVWLCQGAVFELTNPIVINANDQQIATIGLPTDDRRAVLRLASTSLTTAVIMRYQSNAVLSNLIVDGNRSKLGPKEGSALIFAGGSASGQVVRNVKVFDTRSWSSIHFIEGNPSPGQPCEYALVEGNEVGPAGTSNNWADGISLACKNSVVRNNQITDATDGGIVIFGAPGSLIENNLVRAETRILLGGINMVDYAPYKGDYTGTVVRNNTIDAAGAVIRVGLAMGPRVWVCLPQDSPEDTVYGGTVTDNTLKGANMQYGFAVAGVTDWTVTGNVDQAGHQGAPSQDCGGRVASPPSGFLYSPQQSLGTFQQEFKVASLDLALWAIVAPKPGSEATMPRLDTASAFTGTWSGTDPDDGSTMTITIEQNGNSLIATFRDSYSGQKPPPGFEGSGDVILSSATFAQVTFHLSRHDGAQVDLSADLTLSNQNNTLTLDSGTVHWVFTRK